MTSSAGASGRLSWREYTGYALGDTASNLFFQTFNIFLTYYYVDVWGLAPAALATMMLVVRFFDAANDPIMGLISDRTNTRWGKFRPYLFVMAPFYGICGYLLFASPNLEGTSKLAYAYVTYALMLVAYTAINVPYSALLGVLSPISAVRTQASSFRFVGAFGGGLAISMFVRPLVKALGGDDEVVGFQQTMAIFAVVSILLFWVTFFSTRERVEPSAQQRTNVREELLELVKNRPWVVLLFAAIFSTAFQAMRSGSTLFYFKYVVRADDTPILFGIFDRATVFLSSSMASMMLGTLCFGFIAGKADKRRWSVALCAITGVCFAVSYWLPPENYVLMLVFNIFATFCMGPTSALVWAMYADVADYGEWKFGRRSTGLVYSASLFALKTGSMVAGWLLPVVLGRFGFVRDAVQSPTSLVGITLAFSVIPGVLAGLKGLSLWIYPLRGEQVKEIEAELARRRVESERGGEARSAADDSPLEPATAG